MFAFRLFYYFDKRIKTALIFLCFKGLTHAYLEKSSMIYNKCLTFQIFEENNVASCKSVAQRLS